MMALARAAVGILIGTAVYGLTAFLVAMLVAVPLGTAWDVLLWATGSHLPVDMSGVERICRSHFVWGVCAGIGATVWWQKAGSEIMSSMKASASFVDTTRSEG